MFFSLDRLATGRPYVDDYEIIAACRVAYLHRPCAAATRSASGQPREIRLPYADWRHAIRKVKN
jgi:hypothetical protein